VVAKKVLWMVERMAIVRDKSRVDTWVRWKVVSWAERKVVVKEN
jgi:hypothetical protein